MAQNTDNLVKRMRDLYLRFCWPVIVFDKHTGEMTFDYHWENDEAKQLFQMYSDMIGEENTKAMVEYCVNSR